MKNLLIAVTLAVLVWSCMKDTETCVTIPDTSESKIAVTIEPIHDSLMDIQSKQKLVELLTRQPIIRDYIFRRSEYPNDSVFINALYQRFTNPHLDTLAIDVKRVFGDLSALQIEFEEAFSNIKYYYPNFYPPKVQAVISGLDTDMFVSDSLVIISLDFYLGKDAKYRPRIYDYLLRKYDPDDIVPSVMLIYGIEDRFNKTDIKDQTVLADMVAYGKSFYFAKHMLPCVPDSTLIWYSAEEIKGARQNQDLIWARFIESEVLFATSHKVKQDYLGERPITTQVGEKCPGRIGQWMGWQIVNSFAESHPAMTLPEIMENSNAQTLFKQSGYKPNKR